MWLYFLTLSKAMQAIVLYRCYNIVGFCFFIVAFPNCWYCPSRKPGYIEKALRRTSVYRSKGLRCLSQKLLFLSCCCLLVVVAKGLPDPDFISEPQSSSCAWTHQGDCFASMCHIHCGSCLIATFFSAVL